MKYYPVFCLSLAVSQASAQLSITSSENVLRAGVLDQDGAITFHLKKFQEIQRQTEDEFNQTGLYPQFPWKPPEDKLYVEIESKTEEKVALSLCTTSPMLNTLADRIEETPVNGYEYLHILGKGNYEFETTLENTEARCSSLQIDGTEFDLHLLPLCGSAETDYDVMISIAWAGGMPDSNTQYTSLPPGIIQCGGGGKGGTTTGGNRGGGGGFCCFGGSRTASTENVSLNPVVAAGGKPPKKPTGNENGASKATPDLEEDELTEEEKEAALAAAAKAKNSELTSEEKQEALRNAIDLKRGKQRFKHGLKTALDQSFGESIASDLEGIPMTEVSILLGERYNHIQTWLALMNLLESDVPFFDWFVEHCPTGVRARINSALSTFRRGTVRN